MAKEEMSVSAAFMAARMKQRENLIKSFGNAQEVMKDDAEVEKTEEPTLSELIDKGEVNVIFDEETDEVEKAIYADTELNQSLDRVGKEVEVEKSDIMTAISGYGENTIKISKTGKEIKEQVKTVVLPEKQAMLNTYKDKATELLKKCGDAPTKDVPKWWTNEMDIEIPLKWYDWEETYMPCQNCSVAGTLVPGASEDVEDDGVNRPKDKEEQTARRDYNDAVRMVCEAAVDIKACDILTKNLQDGKSFELTPRQIVAFKFD